MLRCEFIVHGPPLSHQTRNRTKLEAWRQRVRDAAAEHWGTAPPSTDTLKIIVVWYHDGPSVRMDNDNLLKPIQDALIGLIYEDDRQLTDSVVRKTNIDGAFRIRGASLKLLEAFSRGKEFLYIQVEGSPDHTELPDG
ncbi:MAG: RusA family crossover junction endodeoxyribonuclease [Planctomycetaceae bacterium]